ncbi:autotransporter outer membrane beta-barrel domain-containing protein [Enterobacter cloacae subsp. cloacae]|uniref:autotransporter outer membrane beta-barrel domain-containing protein n=1 Tax=Enterobacter cloacae TaxID=550 RepID=UPI001C5ADC50|nr:autotransporter outer membrane beta-barrel domain-containing protein [Enterobacter cloacae]MBW4201881.1 autotransporter outer membrane beta-barrel domain-containing protein [Enterobacter cloacae subsp. cloacae]
MTVSNSSISSATGSALSVIGQNADINVQDGTSLNGGNGNILEATDTVTTFNAKNVELNGNVLVHQSDTPGGQSNVNSILNNVIVHGDFIAEGSGDTGGILNINASGTDIYGNMTNVSKLSLNNNSQWVMTENSDTGLLTADSSEITTQNGAALNADSVTLNNGSIFNGLAGNIQQMAINSGSLWKMTDSESIGNLAMDNGTVDFGHGGASNRVLAAESFRTLNLSSLSGNGTFNMATDLAANTGDFLNVNGNATGAYTLAIKNTGAEPEQNGPALQVVHTGSGDALFQLAGGVVDAGVWEYDLVQHGTDWYLEQAGGGGNITPSTNAILSMASAPQFIFNGELANLRQRKGDLRDSAGSEGGLWGRYLTNTTHINGAAGSAYQMEQNGMEFGSDKVIETESGKWLLGAFASYTDNNMSYDRGGSSSIGSTSGGIYATWFAPNGLYVDSVLKANRFNNKLHAQMSDGSSTAADYTQSGIGGAIEAGWTLPLADSYWVEPYSRVTIFRAQSKNVSLDNGMTAALDADKSLQGELGVNTGKTFFVNNMTLMPYLKLAIAREFIKHNNVNVNDVYDFNNDFSGNTGRYGAGLDMQVTKNASVYAEANYQNGNHVETPVMANAGFRISF